MTSTIQFEELHRIIFKKCIHLISVQYSLKVIKGRKIMINALMVGNQKYGQRGKGEVHNHMSERFTTIIGKILD